MFSLNDLFIEFKINDFTNSLLKYHRDYCCNEQKERFVDFISLYIPYYFSNVVLLNSLLVLRTGFKKNKILAPQLKFHYIYHL